MGTSWKQESIFVVKFWRSWDYYLETGKTATGEKTGTSWVGQVVNGFLFNEKEIGLVVAVFNFANSPARLPNNRKYGVRRGLIKGCLENMQKMSKMKEIIENNFDSLSLSTGKSICWSLMKIKVIIAITIMQIVYASITQVTYVLHRMEISPSPIFRLSNGTDKPIMSVLPGPIRLTSAFLSRAHFLYANWIIRTL